MNRRAVMISSALALGLAGAAGSFAPAEVAAAAGIAPSGPAVVLVQLTGALYLSLGLANWTAKESLIGGIYARPLAFANFLHFMMGALALLRHVRRLPPAGIALAVGYTVFAVAFGAILFSSPLPRTPSAD